MAGAILANGTRHRPNEELGGKPSLGLPGPELRSETDSHERQVRDDRIGT
jgi:hypothetical protein